MTRLGRAIRVAAMLLLAGCGDYAWNGTSYGPPPSSSAPPPLMTQVPPGAQLYVVVPGDTVDSVAELFGVPVQALIDANHLTMPFALTGGQQLVIPGAAGAGGGLYTVEPGDTLTRIARQHATSVDQLAAINGLQPPYPLRVGQQLRMPGSQVASTDVGASVNAGAGAQVIEMPPSEPATSVAAAGNSTMTTETLAPPPGATTAPSTAGSGVGVSTVLPSTQSTAGATMQSTTQAANLGGTTAALPPPVLTPVNPAAAASQEPSSAAQAAPSTRQTSTGAAAGAESTGSAARIPTLPPPPTSGSSTISPIGQATAALDANSAQSGGEVPTPRSSGKFLWPVNGKVISPFGPKDGGQHNDGINIAAPLGTPVRAAENGIVVYAGNELRGFGNLLLIRHADGWISAYAHCDSLLVKRGATVKRGQVIARVGQTGSVTSPQLHFELRKGAQAVDPMTELAPQGA